jgi:hypothetical protein
MSKKRSKCVAKTIYLKNSDQSGSKRFIPPQSIQNVNMHFNQRVKCNS